jgi:hypothetical protein
MNANIETAVKIAQARRASESSGYRQDQYDHALDGLLRQPHRPGDPEHLLGAALANARKQLRRRRAIAATFSVGNRADLAYLADFGLQDEECLLWDAFDWIKRAPLTAGERVVLMSAVESAMGRKPRDASPSSQQRLARARASARRVRAELAW